MIGIAEMISMVTILPRIIILTLGKRRMALVLMGIVVGGAVQMLEKSDKGVRHEEMTGVTEEAKAIGRKTVEAERRLP